MTPGTGTPDCAASTTRTLPACRQPSRGRAWLPGAVLSVSTVLAGCAIQPQAPDSRSGAHTDVAVPESAWKDSSRHPHHVQDQHRRGQRAAVDDRAPTSLDSAVVGMPLGDPTRILTDAQSDEATAGDVDAWARIRNGLRWPRPNNSRVARAVDWYRRHPAYLLRMTRRARPYLAFIVREVERRDMSMEFALLPVVESAFRELAYSPAGASGLWQFMPSTGRRYGLKQDWWYDGRRDVVESTRAALDYLTKLLQEFDEDPLLAVAAYNWGEGNVRRAVARNRARGKPTDVWSLRLPRETRSHVSRLLAIAEIVDDPDRYGVVLEPIPDRVQFSQISLDRQIDLGAAADLAGISVRELRRLNPGFKRSATGPDGPHRLQIPYHAVEKFTAGLSNIPPENHSRWARHEIVRGDTLGAIAGRYGVSIAALMRTNGLRSDRILAGRHLMVPLAIGVLDASVSGGETQAEPDRTATDGPTKAIHRVNAGDSLWRIARRHHVDMRQLAAWNGLSVETVLQPGQRLTVYRGRAARSQLAAPTRSAESLNTEPTEAIHVVEYGDTLSEIAERHGTTVLKLAEVNRIEESAVLRPGQKLRLIPAAYSSDPGDPERIRYRVKRGDSLWEISRLFGVSVASLRKWNRLPADEPLLPGRELDVHLTRAPAI